MIDLYNRFHKYIYNFMGSPAFYVFVVLLGAIILTIYYLSDEEVKEVFRTFVPTILLFFSIFLIILGFTS